MLYRFIVLNGPGKGEQSTLPVDELIIGRGDDCGLRLDDPEVAAKHARVLHSPQGPRISDLGSLNRILVNKREVREATLKHGDVIEIGRTQLLLQAYLQADITEESASLPPRRGTRRSIRAAAWVVIALGCWTVYRMYAPTEPEAPAPEPAAPTTPAPEAPTPANTAVSAELRQLREELAAIKSTFQGMVSTTPPTGTSAAPAATPEAPPETAALSQQRQAASEQELEEIKKNIEAGALDQADAGLAQLQTEDPDFLPAYSERARLYELRGELQRAIGQWAQLIQRSQGGALAGQAAEEWVRLAAQQATAQAKASPPTPEAPPPKAEPAPSPSPAPVTASAPEAPRVLILDLSQRRFPESPDYDEMRVIRIDLACPGRKPPSTRSLRLEVSLFDRTGDGDPYLTRVMPSTYVMGPGKTGWTSMGEMSLSVPYVVPRGLRPAGSTEQFYGYVARLYCDDQLQDQDARPLDLLELTTTAPKNVTPAPTPAPSDVPAASALPADASQTTPEPSSEEASAEASPPPPPEVHPPELPERAP